MNDLMNLPRVADTSERAGDGEVRLKLRCDLDVETKTRDPFGRIVVNRMGLSGFGQSRYYLAAAPVDLDAVKALHARDTGVESELERRVQCGEAAPNVRWAITELPD